MLNFGLQSSELSPDPEAFSKCAAHLEPFSRLVSNVLFVLRLILRIFLVHELGHGVVLALPRGISDEQPECYE